MSNMNFTFHETFPPQIIYLAEILELAYDEFEGTKFEISDKTGIPTGTSTGKVEPHIKYLKYMGLIHYEFSEKKYKLSLTDFGKVVYENDKYLLQDITKIMLHYNITRIGEGAPQWSCLFRIYPYNFNEEIQLSNIIENGNRTYGKEINISPLKSSYLTGDFESISPITFNNNTVVFKNVFYSYESIPFYAFSLISEIQKKYSGENEITLNKINNELKWSKGFSFDYETVLEVLEELASRGYIKLNKQLNPITIIANIKSEDLLNKLYDDVI